jgi:hypothetical protein
VLLQRRARHSHSWRGLKMSRKLLSRIIAASVFGIFIGVLFHLDMEKQRIGGREAYLAKMTQRWNRSFDHPDNLVLAIFIMVWLALIVFGLYELLVAGVFRLLGKPSSKEDSANLLYGLSGR